MKSCSRCEGYLAPTVLEERSGRRMIVIPCVHCLNCGDYMDETIMNHRRDQEPGRAWTWAFAS